MNAKALKAWIVQSLKAAQGGSKPPLLVTPWEPQLNNALGRTLQRSGLVPRAMSEAEFLRQAKQLRNQYRVIAPQLSQAEVGPGGTTLRTNPIFDKHDVKRVEARIFRKSMPRSELNLANTLPRRTPVLRGLDQTFGDGKWIMKYVDEAATGPGKLMTKDNIVRAVRSGGKLNVTLKDGTRKSFKMADMIAQERRNIDANPWLRWIDDQLVKWAPRLGANPKSNLVRGMNTINRGTNEFRVHVLNGKSVPGGLAHRGSIIKHVMHALLPFHTPESRRVSEFAERAIRLAPKKYRKGLFGMDIGVDQVGKPFVIESNPTSINGMSAFVDTPLGSDAVVNTAFGSMPRLPIARGLGLAGLGVGIPATAYAVTRGDNNTA